MLLPESEWFCQGAYHLLGKAPPETSLLLLRPQPQLLTTDPVSMTDGGG